MKDDVKNGIPAALLNPAPMTLEMGIQRLPSKALVVACRTEMSSCSGAMLDWWFKYFDCDEHLLWWHPNDHKTIIGWDERREKGKCYIGATIKAVESLGEFPPVKATLRFLDPASFFEADSLANAYEKGQISAAVASGIGFGDDVHVDSDGTPKSGRMMHVARDHCSGLVLRSRFVLGLDTEDGGTGVPDSIGLGLMRHCHSEFTYLSHILPSLYYGDKMNPRPADIW